MTYGNPTLGSVYYLLCTTGTPFRQANRFTLGASVEKGGFAHPPPTTAATRQPVIHSYPA